MFGSSGDDGRVNTVNPAEALPTRPAAVVAIEAPTADVRILRMTMADGAPFAFRAGQYAQVSFAGLPPRDYSLANVPGSETLEFHVRVNAERSVGRHIRDQLAVGDRVSISGPFGQAYLRTDHDGPIVAVAGGTGLVPIRSIIETALGSGMGQPIHLYLGAGDEAELYEEQRFLGLAARHSNLRFVAVVSGPGRMGRRMGNVPDAVANDFATLAGFKAYVAGPPPMVEATLRILSSRGVSAADVHADPFTAGDHHSAPR